MIDEHDLELRLRRTLDAVVPRLAGPPGPTTGELIDVDPARRPRRRLLLIAASFIVVLGAAAVAVSLQRDASQIDGPAPTPTTTVPSSDPVRPPATTLSPTTTDAPSTTSATSVLDSTPTPSSPTAFGDVPVDFGSVDVDSIYDLGLAGAEQWARTYLDALAAGRFDEAATLLARAGWSTLDPLAEVSSSAPLPDQLAEACANDLHCLPALGVVPQWQLVIDPCSSPDPIDCHELRPAVEGLGGDTYWFRFTLDDGGEALRFHPTSSSPDTVDLQVSVDDGRIVVSGLPPARTSGLSHARLPQVTPADTGGAWVTREIDVPGTEHTEVLWTDGTNLCVGGCYDTMFPHGGLGGVSGISTAPDGGDFVLIVGAHQSIDVTILDRDGVPLDLLLRAEAPEIGDFAVWFFDGPDEYSPGWSGNVEVTFTFPDGTRLVE